ncbi:methionine ABC transporter ATP-binding protein [Brevibacillus agri]|nr:MULTISPECIES: methionine ABC transporter ATP-binding protein [Brevibacillus]MBG9564880.1 phosphate ABC transporter ATP-binding protein [Brevibacillus agri]MBY0050087.1 methionine ABC transporter ATP-binding protein [Brevibacillus agri]MCG5253953.1 methionine ABC transporter ATP-binding protein [Brevibacillus agri]MDN4095879.1 methionine ABC transporter ATP-binding protein [Brevibacillus agri]MDR9507511.1 methionine ABC transporter ATP-binding protein [Brevibacillus agri]
MIAFHGVSKTFESGGQTIEALKGVTLDVKKGDIFGVIGFSGAGKSTLLRTVNLLERPTAGSVIVAGKDLTKLSVKELRSVKKNIGMIFQQFNLLATKTVFDNVAMPLRLGDTPKKQIQERVDELLSFVGLTDKATSYPDQLSGGQKQRVGIARALATNPSILLSDEATSALDPQTTESILQLLKRVNQEYNVTILMITHEMNVIKEICNRVAVMEHGAIVEQGNVLDVFANPQTEVARNFVKSVVRDDIPPSVRKLLATKRGKSKILNIHFIGESTGQPLLSQVAKRFNSDVNVLFGSITELAGVPFGNLIVELTGNEAEIVRAYHYIQQQNVTVKEIVS